MAVPNGPAIRAKRISQGIKRPAFAEKVGISYAHLANIENGHTSAAPETLVKIANALDLRPSDVIQAVA